MYFSENATFKNIKNHYLEKVFATRFRDVEKPYKTNGNTVSQTPKSRCGTPDKTYRFLMILRKTQKWTQNDQKAIACQLFGT